MRKKQGSAAPAAGKKPIALILAGYDRLDARTKRQKKKEMLEAYDGEVIYMGHNKFLRNLAGRPIIQYVIDAVFNARAEGAGSKKSSREPLYQTIHLYNDIESFREEIDETMYPNLVLHQMTDSVGGHWKDFYFNHIEYGQRVDVFFGDTPRITSADVEYISGEFSKILGKAKDHRGVTVNMVYGIVEYEDMKKDNWLAHRIKVIKRGANRGKLKSFVGFDGFQARVGNTGAMIKHPTIDPLIEYETLNFVYNLRKALSPSTFSRILYHLWRTKHFDMIRQVKNRCIRETDYIEAVRDVISKLYRIDIDQYGGILYHIKKNAARWENDIDSPLDYEVFKEKFGGMTER